MTSQSRFEGIQVLRGGAALLVLLVHAGIVLTFPMDSPYYGFFKEGAAVGVDLFFVISGFVVAMAAQRSEAKSFLLNRLTRVLPLYVVLSLPLVAIGPMTAIRWWNTLAFVPAFDVGRYTNPAHQFGWTIGLELWFYVVMAAALLVSGRHILRVFCIAMLVMVFSRVFYTGDWLLPIYLGHPMALEFLAGVWIYSSRRYLRQWIGLPLLLAGCWLGWDQTNDRAFLGAHMVILAHYDAAMMRALAWGIPCALIVAGFVACNGLVRWPRPLRWFGDISYSFYMVQPFSLLALKGLDFPSWPVAWAVFFAVNLGFATASHRYLEVPLTRWLRGGAWRPDAAIATSN